MHGVLQPVAAQPVEAEALEDVHPAGGHGHPLVDGLHLALAERVIAPLGHAHAAGVQVRIDVDGDTVDVIGDLVVVVGVPRPDAREPHRGVLVVGALGADDLLHAGQGGQDLGVEPDREAHELGALGQLGGRLLVPGGLPEALEVAVVLGAEADRRALQPLAPLLLLGGLGPAGQEVLADEVRVRRLVVARRRVLRERGSVVGDGGRPGRTPILALGGLRGGAGEHRQDEGEGHQGPTDETPTGGHAALHSTRTPGSCPAPLVSKLSEW